MSREEREKKRKAQKRRSRNIRVVASAAALTLGIIGCKNLGLLDDNEKFESETFTTRIDVGNVEIVASSVPLTEDIQIAVQKYCRLYNVPYSLALAVIQTESSFDSDAENDNCYGYMQIHSINKDRLMNELGVTDLMNPYENIQSGIYLLSCLYEKYDDWNLALVAYNNGESGAYENYFSKGLYSSDYSEKVRYRQKDWEEMIG